MNKETIHIENLSIGYPGKGDVKVVADGICAGINSGELTCLLGAMEAHSPRQNPHMPHLPRQLHPDYALLYPLSHQEA